MMIRRAALAVSLAVGLLTEPLVAEAQSGRTRPTIAVVAANTPVTDLTGPQPKEPTARAFLEAMRELGWAVGRNVTVVWKSAEGHPERYSVIAQELVNLKVDLIVASGSGAFNVRQVTRTIPIVMVGGIADPGLGVETLARPGGNVTGLTMTASSTLKEKRLQLLKEAVPRISRVAHLGDVGTAPSPEAAARALRVTLVPVSVDGPDELQAALATITRQRVDAIFVAPGRSFWGQRGKIIEFAAKQRLPATYPFDVFARDGGLMSYGVNFVDLYRRAATYVDKILKGAKPADLPVEQPTKFELVINLKTAKALGLTIPPSLLLRADQVIE